MLFPFHRGTRHADSIRPFFPFARIQDPYRTPGRPLATAAGPTRARPSRTASETRERGGMIQCTIIGLPPLFRPSWIQTSGWTILKRACHRITILLLSLSDIPHPYLCLSPHLWCFSRYPHLHRCGLRRDGDLSFLLPSIFGRVYIGIDRSFVC